MAHLPGTHPGGKEDFEENGLEEDLDPQDNGRRTQEHPRFNFVEEEERDESRRFEEEDSDSEVDSAEDVRPEAHQRFQEEAGPQIDCEEVFEEDS
jgi:hypothetical protein